MTILGILLSLAFGAFAMSTRIFQDTTTRQSAEVQLRAIKILAERDIELSNFWNIRTYPNRGGDGRDAMVLNALSDWDAPGNFDPATGRPAWDRHVAWYATNETNKPGRLVRQLLAPTLPAGSFLDSPFSESQSFFSDVNPSGNGDAIYTRVLSASVLEFRVTPRLQNGSVKLQIRLLARGKQRQLSSVKTEENLDVTITLTPKNTWPEI